MIIYKQLIISLLHFLQYIIFWPGEATNQWDEGANVRPPQEVWLPKKGDPQANVGWGSIQEVSLVQVAFDLNCCMCFKMLL